MYVHAHTCDDLYTYTWRHTNKNSHAQKRMYACTAYSCLLHLKPKCAISDDLSVHTYYKSQQDSFGKYMYIYIYIHTYIYMHLSWLHLIDELGIRRRKPCNAPRGNIHHLHCTCIQRMNRVHVPIVVAYGIIWKICAQPCFTRRPKLGKGGLINLRATSQWRVREVSVALAPRA